MAQVLFVSMSLQCVRSGIVAEALSVQPTVAAIIGALCGVAAAVASQHAYDDAKQGELPTYFGGRPVEDQGLRSDKTMRADGTRERANARSAFFQTLTTPLLIITALLGLCAAVPTLIVDGVVFIALVAVLAFFLPQWKSWQRDDQKIEAKTEYYVFYQAHKYEREEDIRRLFAKEHPLLASRLD